MALCHLKSIDETRTGRGKIEGRGIDAANLLLDETGRRWAPHIVGGRRGENDQVDFLGLRSGIGQSTLSRLRSQRGGHFLRCRHMAVLNARMRNNPLRR